MTRFLNYYECPCGEEWSNEDDCTCDDRCPTCHRSCSPVESEDAECECGRSIHLCIAYEGGDEHGDL